MSNFGLFNFNISKATPTTSTTNANTTSLAVSKGPTIDCSPQKASKILSTSTSSSLKPHEGVLGSTEKLGSTYSEAASAEPNYVSASLTKNDHISENQDLINIFERFSTEASKDSGEAGLYDIHLDQPRESKHGMNLTESAIISHVKTDSFLGNQNTDLDNSASSDKDSSASALKLESEKQTLAQNILLETEDIFSSPHDEPIKTRKDVALIENESNLIGSESQNSTVNNNTMTIQPYVIEESNQKDNESGSFEPGLSLLSTNNETSTSTLELYPMESTNDFLAMDANESVEEVQFEVKRTSDFNDSEHSPDALRQRPRTIRKDSIAKASKGIVNASEQHRESHRPFDFQIFLSHLKNKNADPIVRYIRSFLMSFARQARSMSATQMMKAIKNFRLFIEEKFHVYEPFASMDEKDLENSVEGVEKLIMNRLYDFCFPPEARKKFSIRSPSAMANDLADDAEFANQIDKFSWVLGVHLDVDLDDLSERKRRASKDNIEYMEYAARELNKINNYRAPRDKIICILNACKILFSLLRITDQETNADAFIPLLILVILKAKTENIICNLHYIERFRGENWLNHGETSYYLSTVQGAITFIRNIKKEDLTIDESHFDAHIEAWDAELRQRRKALENLQNNELGTESSQLESPPLQAGILPSNVLIASAEMLTKSISSFIAPSEEAAPGTVTETNPQIEQSQAPTSTQVDGVYCQLCEIFPSLDKDIMRDVIILNKADFERSLDVCLQLANDD